MTAPRILGFALCAVLVYVLYLPSTNPPQQFLRAIRLEHERNAAFWGAREADHILELALSLYARRGAFVPAAFASAQDTVAEPPDTAAALELSAALRRLLHNAYAQALDALAFLATYRFCALCHWLPRLAGFAVIACWDGCLRRAARSREFLPHSPARFALCMSGAALAVALLVLLLVVPAAVGPALPGCTVLLFSAFAAAAISHLRD